MFHSIVRLFNDWTHPYKTNKRRSQNDTGNMVRRRSLLWSTMCSQQRDNGEVNATVSGDYVVASGEGSQWRQLC